MSLQSAAPPPPPPPRNNDNDDAYTTCSVTPNITLRILEDLKDDDDDDDKNDVEQAVGRFVWPTARPLLRHLLGHGGIVLKNPNEKRVVVLEVGAGCGVLGMGLAQAVLQKQFPGSSWHFVLTDHDVDWLERNVALNFQPDAPANSMIQVSRLEWGNPQDICMVKEKIQTLLLLLLLLDDNNHQHDVKELWIVGSDILYNHEAHKVLADTMWQIAASVRSQVTTRIILGFPDRDNDEQSFLPWARQVFGESFPFSQPLPVVVAENNVQHGNRNEKKATRTRKRMDLRIIDFTVPSDLFH